MLRAHLSHIVADEIAGRYLCGVVLASLKDSLVIKPEKTTCGYNLLHAAPETSLNSLFHPHPMHSALSL